MFFKAGDEVEVDISFMVIVKCVERVARCSAVGGMVLLLQNFKKWICMVFIRGKRMEGKVDRRGLDLAIGNFFN